MWQGWCCGVVVKGVAKKRSTLVTSGRNIEEGNLRIRMHNVPVWNGCRVSFQWKMQKTCGSPQFGLSLGLRVYSWHP